MLALHAVTFQPFPSLLYLIPMSLPSHPHPLRPLVLKVWDEGEERSYWWNAVLRESSAVKPMAFEESLVGMRVWLTRPTSEGLSGKGQLTR